MTIAAVTSHIVVHRRKEPMPVRAGMCSLLVRVDTEDGLVGWGEAFGFGSIATARTAVDTLVGPLAVGRSFEDPAVLYEDIARTLHHYGRGGPARFALAGLDIALWDLAGKKIGRSTSTLFGAVFSEGRVRDSVDAYASLPKYGDPDKVRRHVQIALDQGFRAVKVHEITDAAVAAARATMGPDLRLMVDCNCAWTREDAIGMAQLLKRHNLTWLEEPVWPPEDVEGIQRIARAGKVPPLALGENLGNIFHFQPYIDAPAPTYLQPSVIKVSISEFLKIARAAIDGGHKLAPHSAYLGPGLLAALQLAAAIPAYDIIEFFNPDLEMPLFGPIGRPGPDGRISIPDCPGLGADPLPKALEALRFDPPADFNWAPPVVRPVEAVF
jgi:L-alanine-DL-glutamate epimerase-like enolase superfamily enzyme